MVNAWLNTVKEVQAKVPKGTLLKDILHKAKIIYEKKNKKKTKRKSRKRKTQKKSKRRRRKKGRAKNRAKESN